MITGDAQLRIGQRTIASKYGRGPKMATPSRAHITRQVESLAKKGCLVIGDTNRDGTLYTLVAPEDVPSVKLKLESPGEEVAVDFFNSKEGRSKVYERDEWRCRYCGDQLNEKNITLDHFIPQHTGKDHSFENLRTACLSCNSIKSGHKFEDIAPALLESIAKRRAKTDMGEQDVPPKSDRAGG